MMKKVSYLLVLLISTFMINTIVEAKDCLGKDGNTYTFDSRGDIVSIKGEVDFWYYPYSGAMNKTTKKIDSVSRNYQNTKDNNLHLEPELIDPDICPNKEEISYSVTESNVYTVTVADSYIKRVNPDNSTEKGNTETTDINGCSDITDMVKCKSHGKFSCVWVDKTTGNISNSQENGYCNVDTLQYVMCGREENATFDIPVYLPRIISFIINFLKIVTPIVLIFTSAISLLKAITASKEDEMEKAKKTLIRRIAIAALIFFTITITQFVIEKVADDEEITDFKDCLSCFVNNDCNASKYYKNNIDGEYKCFTVKNKTPIDNCH